MAADPILQQALSLSPAERVRLIDQLLESVISAPAAGELSQDQKAELLRRLAANRTDPGSAVPSDQARQQLKRPA